MTQRRSEIAPDRRRDWKRLWSAVAAALAEHPSLASDPLEDGKAHAARREWGPAAACYARSMSFGLTDDGQFWFEYAALLLLSGDRNGYAKACAHMVERCRPSPNLRAYHVARACTLATDSVADARGQAGWPRGS